MCNILLPVHIHLKADWLLRNSTVHRFPANVVGLHMELSMDVKNKPSK